VDHRGRIANTAGDSVLAEFGSAVDAVECAVRVQTALELDPTFAIRRFRNVTSAFADNPTFLAGRERSIIGMRIAGVPEA
jgi:class 3 adenylate cyclase